MKKLVVATVVSAMALVAPSIAFAAHVPVGQTFKNRGQCEAAIAQARNDARRDSVQNAGEYNRDFQDSNFFCDDNGNGTFTIVDGPDRD